jgi:hypothetical protein
MTGPDFVGAEQPVEDVLEQRRDDVPAEEDDHHDGRETVPPPAEADEADYVEQQMALPPDDGYPEG